MQLYLLGVFITVLVLRSRETSVDYGKNLYCSMRACRNYISDSGIIWRLAPLDNNMRLLCGSSNDFR